MVRTVLDIATHTSWSLSSRTPWPPGGCAGGGKGAQRCHIRGSEWHSSVCLDQRDVLEGLSGWLQQPGALLHLPSCGIRVQCLNRSQAVPPPIK